MRPRDPKGTAEWYRRVFGAEVLESVQSDGQPRIDLNDDLDAAYAQLKDRGATFTTEPRTIRPGGQDCVYSVP